MRAHIAVGIACAVVLAVAWQPVIAGESSSELVVQGRYFRPKDDDNYDKGYGAEVQMRWWLGPSWGMAAAIGFCNWEVDEEEAAVAEYVPGYAAYEVYASIEGDVRLVPVGVSLICRAPVNEQVSVRGEAGIRYVIVESDAEGEVQVGAAVPVYGGAVAVKDEIDIDDGIIGVLAGELNFKASEAVSFLAGVGYQFDVSKGDVEWAGEDCGENELQAWFLMAGVSLKL